MTRGSCTTRLDPCLEVRAGRVGGVVGLVILFAIAVLRPGSPSTSDPAVAAHYGTDATAATTLKPRRAGSPDKASDANNVLKLSAEPATNSELATDAAKKEAAPEVEMPPAKPAVSGFYQFSGWANFTSRESAQMLGASSVSRS